VSSEGKASVRPLERPLDGPGDEAVTGTRGEDAPVEKGGLLERVLDAATSGARSTKSDATRAPQGSTG
jgi:hypothetical protein